MTNKEKIYKHTIFIIGETFVDVDKCHISAKAACEKIRRCLQELDMGLPNEICLKCIHYNSISGYCYKHDTYSESKNTCEFWRGFEE